MLTTNDTNASKKLLDELNLLSCKSDFFAAKHQPLGKKNGKKADNVRFGRPPLHPKRVKSGHLLSEKSA